MDYALTTVDSGEKRQTLISAGRALAPLLADQKGNIAIAVVCVTATTVSNLLAPVLIAHVIDTAMKRGDYGQLLRYAAMLAMVYVAALGTSYLQTLRMGTVGRNILFQLRNRLFTQLSDLPIAFFAQNRAGDLISRVNNDTDKINVFFSQSLVQMVSNLFLTLGAGILLLSLNWRLGLMALVPALVMLMVTRMISPWVRRPTARAWRAWAPCRAISPKAWPTSRSSWPSTGWTISARSSRRRMSATTARRSRRGYRRGCSCRCTPWPAPRARSWCWCSASG